MQRQSSVVLAVIIIYLEHFQFLAWYCRNVEREREKVLTYSKYCNEVIIITTVIIIVVRIVVVLVIIVIEIATLQK